FVLIAITSSLKDYRLCHFVNKATGLMLSKVDDYEVWFPAPLGRTFFGRYEYFPTTSETEYYLLANKGVDGGFLIPEMRHFDYFLLIKNFIDEEDLMAMQERIAEIPDVLVASEISPEKLKSK